MPALRPRRAFREGQSLPAAADLRALARATGATAHELHRVYNLGHRMEVYCASEHSAAVIAAAQAHGIAARVVGRTEPTRRPDGANHVTIRAAGETLEYAL